MPSLTRPARGRVQERREAVEQQVLDAVERLLRNGHSFTALPVQRIAEEAGMARTTFYGHFPDKTVLLVRLADSATVSVFERAREWLSDDAASWEQHVAVIEAIVAQRRLHQPLLRALDEVAAYDPEVERHVRERFATVVDGLRARIERDMAAGLVTAPIDPQATASLVVLGTAQVLALQAATEPPERDPAFAEGLARATWTAIGRSG